MASPYKISIPLFEGPLDLLLDLIKKQEMNIHDIPISKITSQYLEYLHQLENLDVDVSAEFIYMAATLILTKSKMLLPPDPLASAEEQARQNGHLPHDVGTLRERKGATTASIGLAATRSGSPLPSAVHRFFPRRALLFAMTVLAASRMFPCDR